ncbi:MAG: hypothetical protein HYX26_06530 [Acidobacteriales bacterium]|nr:hypothetical protein [Terriglobales bacterium]
MELQRIIKNSANWFYWIAGLSLINTILSLSGAQWRFILGLGLTQVVDEVAKNLGGLGPIIGFVVDAMALTFFVLMGVFANKHHKWAFILGMIAFLLDGGVSLLAADWIGLIFHAWVLWSLWAGFSKIDELNSMQPVV